MSLLDLHRLTQRFGGLTAVKDFDLAVEAGKIVSVIGPNGAGKTTVFNAITGVYEPSGGQIRFRERDLCPPFTARVGRNLALVGLLTGLITLVVMHLEPLWVTMVTANYVFRKPFPWGKGWQDGFAFLGAHGASVSLSFLIGWILGVAGTWVVWLRQRRAPHAIAALGICRTFQNLRLFPTLTVLENVVTGMDLHLKSRLWQMVFRTPGFRREEAAARAEGLRLLDFVGLGARAQHIAGSLPYGDQRRLEIARALATRPTLLLLDEPAAGMNPAETSELMKLIERIRQSGVTVLLIEHHMKVVMGISDRIAVLNYGTKIAEGTPAEVRADPGVVEAYLGREEVE